MDERPERVADYFVVVGLDDKTATKFEAFSASEEEEGVDQAREGCGQGAEPITDIAVIHSKLENLPEGYKLLDSTVGGNSANVNSGSLFASPVYLCYSREKNKPPIVEIGVHHGNQHQTPPPGHELLDSSIGGHSASLSRNGGHLTLKRGLPYGHNNAVTGLCIIMPSKGEELPPGYKLLSSLDLCRGFMGTSLSLCYCTSLVHPTSVPYTPELLTRYPAEDHPEFPLPESIPLFCLPSGVAVEHWDSHTPFPLPTFSTFALTNAQGQCMYGAVVSFYEPLLDHRCHDDMRKALRVDEKAQLHVSKCVCVLSHWPFFSAFKSFLSSLYRLSVSTDIPLPLERYISKLMSGVPFPTSVRPRVQLQIGNENIVFSLPVQTPLPLSVSTHWSLLSSLDPDNCLTLLALTLLEQKIVFHSFRPALLTWVGEALRSILFPFAWQCTYIPVCPLAFSSYMQAPVPFIIGINSHYFDVFEKPSDVCIVDLDAGYIAMGKEARHLLESKPLPSRPSRQLLHRLSQLRSKVVGLDTGMDLAVEVAPMNYKETYKSDLETVDVEIREAFLHYFATILGHYRKCLRPLLSAPSDRSHDITHLFDQQLFLKHCPTADSAFFSYFFDTQIFTAFIEQRSFAHTEDSALAFFDDCTEKVHHNPQAQLLDAAAIVSRRSDLPTVVALPPDDIGLPKGKTYTYPTFPSRLDSSLFATQSGCGDQLRPHPSTHRGSTIQSGSPLVARRTAAEKKKDNKLLEEAAKSDMIWGKTLLSHVCSLWYMLLPPHLSNHWNKMAVLSQAFELLEDMRKNKALPSDEVCYRILMDQCVRLGRPALAVRVYHQMIRAGIQPNAITYGFYNKAVLESHWLSSRLRWRACFIAITACMFLNNIKNKKNRIQSRGNVFGDADFSLIGQKRNTLSSRKSIEALNVVGVAGGVASAEDGEGLSLCLPAASIHRGSVYKMTVAPKGGVGHVISSQDSAPMEGTGLWANVQLVTGGQSPKASRVLSRMTSQINSGTSPSVTIEMTSCTQCPSCQSVLYDEQLMSGWSCDEADYKTACPYCDFKMVVSLSISVTKTLPQIETTSLQTPPTATPTSLLREESEEVDGVKQTTKRSPSEKKLRRAQPPRLLSREMTGNGVRSKDKETAAVCTKGESTSNVPTSKEWISPHSTSSSSLEHALTVTLTPPNTDPLHRRTNGRRDDKEVGGVSMSGGTMPVHQRSKSKVEEVEEPDVGNLSSYITRMRSRGHKRATSAPIRHQLQTTPTGRGVAISIEQEKSVQQDTTSEEKKTYLTDTEPPHMVPYLSPIVLRKEVESLLSLAGSDALESEDLLTDRPIIYWNLVWYFSRLYLPTYLPLLKLKALTKSRPDLEKHSIHMRVSLMWDRRFTEVREPLYLIWEGKVPRSVRMASVPQLIKRDSESQIQSLVARTQCGDLCPVICSLLKDRTPNSSPSSSSSSSFSKANGNGLPRSSTKDLARERERGWLTSRSIYREILFLKSVLNTSINTDLFDREYSHALQRVPRDLSSLLEAKDHPPSGRALYCRRNFGPLQVI